MTLEMRISLVEQHLERLAEVTDRLLDAIKAQANVVNENLEHARERNDIIEAGLHSIIDAMQ